MLCIMTPQAISCIHFNKAETRRNPFGPLSQRMPRAPRYGQGSE